MEFSRERERNRKTKKLNTILGNNGNRSLQNLIDTQKEFYIVDTQTCSGLFIVAVKSNNTNSFLM